MRIVIIGAVAAGTSAAAKARRNDESAEIIIYEKDRFISYSGCGMPYYLGGEVDSADKLTPRDPTFFAKKYQVDIRIRHEVLAVHPESKSVDVRNLETGETFTDIYDRLVLATGASAVIPPIGGMDKDHVFTLRNIVDMNRIKAFLDERTPKTAAIIGTGFIGLEVCESLTRLGIQVTLIERLPQVTPGLDPDVAAYVRAELIKNGVTVHTGVTATEILGGKRISSDEHSLIPPSKESSQIPTSDESSLITTFDTPSQIPSSGDPSRVRLSDGRDIPADMVLVSVGVRPNTTLAVNAGVALGPTRAIAVAPDMRTNVPDIYACGDCIEQFHLVTGKPVYRPLGSTANKTGRIAGDAVTGGPLTFRGILGTGIFRVFDLDVAMTGLSEKEAREEGFDPVVCHNIKPARPEYMGGKEIVIKGIADRATGLMLGAQIVGGEGVDKRIDVFVTAITYRAKAEDLFHLDLAYAPPFSTTKDPVMYTGMILDNAISRGRELITQKDLDALIESGEPYQLIDAREPGQFAKNAIPTAVSLPHAAIREKAGELDADIPTVTYCNKGVTGNAAQNILLGRGFRDVKNVSGGQKQYAISHREAEQEKEMDK